MILTQLSEDLENDFKWRIEEINILKNNLLKNSNTPESIQHDDYVRKIFIVFLYAHFEGFTKNSFFLYKEAINSLCLLCKQVNHTIAASSFYSYFRKLEEPRKLDKLKKAFPSDTKLHKLYRRQEFFSDIEDIWNQKINIPDEVIDTESNLRPDVLKKILYSFGFNLEWIDESKSKIINDLVNYRNSITHGNRKKGFESNEYNIIEESIIDIMKKIKSLIIINISNQEYLK
jgi:hypothetical protein